MTRSVELAKNFFTNPALFYVFVFEYTDGTVRQHLLKITERHYKSLRLAKQWHDEIQQELEHVDHLVGQAMAQDVRNLLSLMYQAMTKHGK